MSIKLIQKALKYINNKLVYPIYFIKANARVCIKTKIGGGVRIGKRSNILNSILEENVIVQEKCTIINSNINQNTKIYSCCSLSDVTIGKFSYIAPEGQVNFTEIGNFCSIGSNLICGFGEHPTDFVSTSPVFFSTLKQCGASFTEKNYFVERKKITIGHDVWIGARVFVKDGVTISDGAIIATGAVVVKDVPSYAIVGGVPAKIIRFRFSKDIIEELIKIKWWIWSEERLKKAQPYFAQKDIYSFLDWAKDLNIYSDF
jgi:chloramphenicol O-acetyltransferase type B